MSRFACAICLLIVIGIPVSLAYAERKHPAEERGIQSPRSDVEVSLEFRNKSGREIKVYWIDFEGKRKLYQTLKPGETYLQPKAYLGHPWLVTDAEDNALGLYVADGQPRIVDIQDDLPTAKPAGPPIRQGGIAAAVFSPEASSILTSGSIGSFRRGSAGQPQGWVRVWDVASGQSIGQPFGDEKSFTSVFAAPDGKTVLIQLGSRPNNVFRLADAVSGKYLGDPLPANSTTSRALFSADCKRLFTWSFPNFGGTRNQESPPVQEGRLWDTSTGQPVGEPLHANIREAAFSSDGKVLATVLNQTGANRAEAGNRPALNTIQLWDATTGARAADPIEPGSPVNSIFLNPDGSRILTGLSSGSFGASSGIELALWDKETSKVLSEPVKVNVSPGSPFTAMVGTAFASTAGMNLGGDWTFCPDGKTVLAADNGSEARTWDLMERKTVRRFMHGDRISRVAVSPDGHVFLTASASVGRPARIRLWNADNGTPVCDIPHEGPLSTVAFSRDGRVVLTATNEAIRVWYVPQRSPQN